jgi:hypothetical protein
VGVTATETRVTRREFYGTPFELTFWLVLILACPLLMLYGLSEYPPLVTDAIELLFVALGVYGIVAALMIAFRKKLMPWGEKAPGAMWFGVFGLPVPTALAGIGVFLVANATLDRSSSTDVRTVIDGIRYGKEVELRTTPFPTTRILFDISQVDHDNVEHGDSVQLHVEPGALGLPWITGYTLRRIPNAMPPGAIRSTRPHPNL